MSDVNFTPTRGAYKELTPFRYWCQKVLPLVYDDSISYYELLCKVVNYLNITMEDVSTLNDDVTAMYTAYNELQDFVNQYFTDLNVQTQIDNKLDRMAADGSLNALIDPLVIDTTETSVANTLPGVVYDQLPDVVEDQIDNVVGEQIDGVVADQIQGAADNWLGIHISGSNALDSTLTLYNAAARSMSAGNLIDTYAKYLGAENRITAFATGYWENDNGVMVHPSESNLAYMSVDITVNPGDKYTIIAPAFIDVYSYVPRYAFTDNNYNVISVSDAAEQGAINKMITAPAGATKLIVNDNLVVDPNVDTRFSKMILVKGELTGTAEISDLKADLNYTNNIISEVFTNKQTLDKQFSYQMGGISSNDGSINRDSSWKHTDFIYTSVPITLIIKGTSSSSRCRIAKYNLNGTFVGYNDYTTDPNIYLLEPTYKYRIMVAAESGVTFKISYSSEWLINNGFSFSNYDHYYVNITLSTVDGTEASSGSYDATPFLDVRDIDIVYANKCRNCILYDANKTFLKAYGTDNTAGSYYYVESASFIRFTIKKADLQTFKMYYYVPDWSELEVKLFGQVLYSFGDSIMYGHYSGEGIADGFAEKYRLDYHKLAVNGARLAGTGSGTVYNQILNATIPVKANFIFLEGWVNDASNTNYPTIGEIVIPEEGDDITARSYTTTTFIGTIEHIFRSLYLRFGIDVEIMFVTPHKMCTRPYNNQVNLHDAAESTCFKWSIPFIDVFKSGIINTYVGPMKDKWSYNNEGETSGGNGTHLTGAAYNKYFMPMIVEEISKHI